MVEVTVITDICSRCNNASFII